jgi:hypothetical protein
MRSKIAFQTGDFMNMKQPAKPQPAPANKAPEKKPTPAAPAPQQKKVPGK